VAAASAAGSWLAPRLEEDAVVSLIVAASLPLAAAQTGELYIFV